MFRQLFTTDQLCPPNIGFTQSIKKKKTMFHTVENERANGWRSNDETFWETVDQRLDHELTERTNESTTDPGGANETWEWRKSETRVLLTDVRRRKVYVSRGDDSRRLFIKSSTSWTIPGAKQEVCVDYLCNNTCRGRNKLSMEGICNHIVRRKIPSWQQFKVLLVIFHFVPGFLQHIFKSKEYQYLLDG